MQQRRTKEELLKALKRLNAKTSPVDPATYWNRMSEISEAEQVAFDSEEKIMRINDHQMNERFTI